MNLKNLIKTLGPGILFASTAIGVSHLVQSTRAGANYGFALVWAILLSNIFKYPFFEFGSRYANATGKSIIDGYERMGKWMLYLYVLITLGSMFFVTAAVGAVTAGFLKNLFGQDVMTYVAHFLSNVITLGENVNYFKPESFILPVSLLFTICLALLLIGKFNVLDSLVKIIGIVLLITTILAFFLTIGHGPVPKVANFEAPQIWTETGIAFLIALMGWMPTAVDLSAWNSLWTVARIEQTGYKPSLKETLFDFNFGYIVSAVLSLCFVTMGAYLIFGTGQSMPNKSHEFANGVVELYTTTIGQWSYWIIAAAAFSIMFGTSIAVFDGYARALNKSAELIFPSQNIKKQGFFKSYNYALLIVGIGSFMIIYFFGSSLKSLVDLATTISFLIAPIIAIVNFKLVLGKDVPASHKPGKWLRTLSVLGIIFLSGFSLFFIYTKL
ncbi:MAG: divalent metal cation transporter [Flavobacteriales bacterium]|nr:divalent metal cation transporter [Flavobacteriales bacterium]